MNRTTDARPCNPGQGILVLAGFALAALALFSLPAADADGVAPAHSAPPLGVAAAAPAQSGRPGAVYRDSVPPSAAQDAVLHAASMPTDAADLEAWREDACLALAIYFEARSEPLAGQRAVGDVILNRVRSDAYPDDVCAVVRQGARRRHACQFSFVCDGLSDRPYEQRVWEQATHLAWEMLYGNGDGPLRDNVLHYHADYVTPPWARTMSRVAQIGKHVFYSGDRRL